MAEEISSQSHEYAPATNETSSSVAEKPREVKKVKRRKAKAGKRAKVTSNSIKSSKPAQNRVGPVAFPKHSLENCLRIPQTILQQNAGNAFTDREAAKYAKIGWGGEIGVEISSAIKYGLLERPASGKIKPTDLVRKIARPQQPDDRLNALREAVLKAPVVSDVYKRYRGENLPDREFLVNTAIDSYKVPKERVNEFIDVFIQTLKDAELLELLENGKIVF